MGPARAHRPHGVRVARLSPQSKRIGASGASSVAARANRAPGLTGPSGKWRLRNGPKVGASARAPPIRPTATRRSRRADHLHPDAIMTCWQRRRQRRHIRPPGWPGADRLGQIEGSNYTLPLVFAGRRSTACLRVASDGRCRCERGKCWGTELFDERTGEDQIGRGERQLWIIGCRRLCESCSPLPGHNDDRAEPNWLRSARIEPNSFIATIIWLGCHRAATGRRIELAAAAAVWPGRCCLRQALQMERRRRPGHLGSSLAHVCR